MLNLNTNKLAIAWIDLKYYARNLLEKNPKLILNGLCGSVDFGTITALMGPSGAGKSTLLMCLNGRNLKALESGSQIYLSSHLKSTFISQNISDHLLIGLTAIQSLIYASKLKNSETNIDHNLNAKNIMSSLDISDIENTLVERCSGGQQKCLVIALELTSIEKPNFLCIDEPTSGLDCCRAEIMINTLKDVALKYNIAVITSIHQPNNELVALFNNLYVLSKHGVCVYWGIPSELRYFLMQNQVICNENQVPIEVLIKICTKTDGSSQKLAEVMLRMKNELKESVQNDRLFLSKGVSQKKLIFNLTHLKQLMSREICRLIRYQWITLGIRLMFLLSLGLSTTLMVNKHIGESDGCNNPLGYGLTNNESCHKKEESSVVQNYGLQSSLVFQMQIIMGFSTLLLFSSELRIIVNEIRNGWYSTGSVFWAKIIFQWLLCVVNIFFYTIIVYKMNNQINEQARFWAYYAVLTLSSIVCETLAILIAIFIGDKVNLLFLVLGVIMFTNFLLSGVFAPVLEFPKSIQWITYLTFTKSSIDMIMTILYGFGRCPDGQLSLILCQMDLIDPDKFWVNADILLIHLAVYICLAFILLIIKTKS